MYTGNRVAGRIIEVEIYSLGSTVKWNKEKEKKEKKKGEKGEKKKEKQRRLTVLGIH